MAYIVIENCQDCMFTDCVEVCPVDCFYEARDTDRMLYINPDDCIDCRQCVDECPVAAIHHADDLPQEKAGFVALNRDWYAGNSGK